LKIKSKEPKFFFVLTPTAQHKNSSSNSYNIPKCSIAMHHNSSDETFGPPQWPVSVKSVLADKVPQSAIHERTEEA
jgi:hypothetical protein